MTHIDEVLLRCGDLTKGSTTEKVFRDGRVDCDAFHGTDWDIWESHVRIYKRNILKRRGEWTQSFGKPSMGKCSSFMKQKFSGWTVSAENIPALWMNLWQPPNGLEAQPSHSLRNIFKHYVRAARLGLPRMFGPFPDPFAGHAVQRLQKPFHRREPLWAPDDDRLCGNISLIVYHWLFR